MILILGLSMKKVKEKKISPSGKERIVLLKDFEKQVLFFEDFEKGDRSFELEVCLIGEGSEVEVYGSLFTNHQEKKEWNITLILCGKNQKGSLFLKGGADENSSFSFFGGGRVESTAEESHLFISEKGVLFSKKAQAKIIPLLRVETENVIEASHSASIAPFSEEIFFALSCRGISPKKAKNILKKGFLKY